MNTSCPSLLEAIGRQNPVYQKITILTVLFELLGLAAYPAQCQAGHREQKIYTAAAFGPDHKLWRLTPSQTAITVDYSLDYGKTFSQPVTINQEERPMNFWDENPPSLSVNNQGKVYVLYFADDKQKSTAFFSQSDDGIHFSEPFKISSKADVSYHYQAEMLVDTHNKVHFIWHDLRDSGEYKKKGGGDLSIYYSSTDKLNKLSRLKDHRIAKNICSCCRTAMTLNIDGNPVLLARFVYPGNIWDHGMLKLSNEGKAKKPWRVTFDNWKITACPTQGPALSISNTGRYHMTWFTQGNERTGQFYAWSDDKGKHFSTPLQVGDPDHLPGRADVLAIGSQVALTWKDFDGGATRIMAIHSEDRGLSWSSPKKLAETQSQSAHPALISDGNKIYLSWSSLDTGYLLVPID